MHRFPLLHRFLASLALTILALAGLTACSDDDALPTPADSAILSIQLKDAPGDIKKAVVTISEVFMQGAPVGRVVLSTLPKTFELTALKNRTATLIDSVTVPNGTYIQLRFVITGAFIEVENDDGSTSIFASSPNYEGLPPGAQVSGVLRLPGELKFGSLVTLPNNELTILGRDRNLVVDFDVEQSFIQTGSGIAAWTLSPVLTATDMATAGTIKVLAQLDPAAIPPVIDGRTVTLADFSVELTAPGGFKQQLQLRDTGGGETFQAEFRLLSPATYTINFVGPPNVILTTTPLTPIQLAIASNETKTQSFNVLEFVDIGPPTPSSSKAPMNATTSVSVNRRSHTPSPAPSGTP